MKDARGQQRQDAHLLVPTGSEGIATTQPFVVIHSGSVLSSLSMPCHASYSNSFENNLHWPCWQDLHPSCTNHRRRSRCSVIWPGYWKIPGYLTKNTRVFFSTPVLWCHITGVLTNTRVFSIKYPGIWQPVKYPGKWQWKQRAVCRPTGISGVLRLTDFSLSSSSECYVNGYYWNGASARGGQGSDCEQK